jgi:hypothetical protein
VPSVTAKLTVTSTGAPLAGEQVVFTVKNSSGAVTTLACGPLAGGTHPYAVTNSSGVATCDLTGAVVGIAVVVADGGFTATFNGDASYLPSTGSAGITG